MSIGTYYLILWAKWSIRIVKSSCLKDLYMRTSLLFQFLVCWNTSSSPFPTKTSVPSRYLGSQKASFMGLLAGTLFPHNKGFHSPLPGLKVDHGTSEAKELQEVCYPLLALFMKLPTSRLSVISRLCLVPFLKIPQAVNREHFLKTIPASICIFVYKIIHNLILSHILQFFMWIKGVSYSVHGTVIV